MATPGEQPTTRQLEREQKFDLEPEAPLPGLGGSVAVGVSRHHQLRAVYLDTPDLLLIRHRVTLRRREGGGDEGWHLKLPAQVAPARTEAGPDGTTRWELHAPLTQGPGRWRVPPGHLEAVAEQLGEVWSLRPAPERGLVPVAVLSTRRTEVDLTDEAGRVVAVLCDDTVRAEPAGRTWRELEVELTGDGAGPTEATVHRDLLADVIECFGSQGVQPAHSPSKLSRALGDRPARAEQGLGPGQDDQAADVVLAYLREQVAAILGWEAGVRADTVDAVHKTRVACRRLRSALRTFRRLLDRGVSDPLRGEIRWFGEVLGGPRDAEVQKARLLDQLADLPEDLLDGPVRERIRDELGRQHDHEHAALVRAMDGERYAALVDDLVELVADPPWRGRAHRRAGDVLPPLVEKAVERARAGWEAASAAEAEERVDLLHETRKAAKAVRYGWEVLAPVLGDDAAAAVRAWEEVTEALGAVQDAVVAHAWVRDLRAAALRAGEPDHSYAVLMGVQLEARGAGTRAGERAIEAALGS